MNSWVLLALVKQNQGLKECGFQHFLAIAPSHVVSRACSSEGLGDGRQLMER